MWIQNVEIRNFKRKESGKLCYEKGLILFVVGDRADLFYCFHLIYGCSFRLKGQVSSHINTSSSHSYLFSKKLSRNMIIVKQERSSLRKYKREATLFLPKMVNTGNFSVNGRSNLAASNRFSHQCYTYINCIINRILVYQCQNVHNKGKIISTHLHTHKLLYLGKNFVNIPNNPFNVLSRHVRFIRHLLFLFGKIRKKIANQAEKMPKIVSIGYF